MGNSLIIETLTWDTLRRLHKINNYLASAASEIEELGLEAGHISEKLQAFSGITIWKLRDICDFLFHLEKAERSNAQKFQEYLDGKVTREDMEVPMEYQI
jgi:hypothetical protein